MKAYKFACIEFILLQPLMCTTLSADVNECDSGGDICSENANCTNLEESSNCTCNPGYTENGVNCTSK